MCVAVRVCTVNACCWYPFLRAMLTTLGVHTCTCLVLASPASTQLGLSRASAIGKRLDVLFPSPIAISLRYYLSEFQSSGVEVSGAAPKQ